MFFCPKTLIVLFTIRCSIFTFFKKDLILPNFYKFSSNIVLIDVLEYFIFSCGNFKHKKLLKFC